jgi:NADH-ubiquinone oxidoreductase chain 2
LNQIFLDKPEYKWNDYESIYSRWGFINNDEDSSNLFSKKDFLMKIPFKNNNIVLSSSLTLTVSILTLIILLFIFISQEWLDLANILAFMLFNT